MSVSSERKMTCLIMWFAIIFTQILSPDASPLKETSDKTHQSPVAINTQTCVPCPNSTRPLKYSLFWDKDVPAIAVNNGETVQVRFSNSSVVAPAVTKGPLTSTYSFIQMHFHWGPNDNVGSEHTYNNQTYTMEAHFVNYKQEYLSDVQRVFENKDGIAVIAFFLKVSSDEDNEFLEPLVKVLKSISEPNSTAELNAKNFLAPFYLKVLSSDYFTYQGSLTTEPYSETVTWIVFHGPIPISHRQAEAFRKLKNEEGEEITRNYRKIQALNGRTVSYCSYDAYRVCGLYSPN